MNYYNYNKTETYFEKVRKLIAADVGLLGGSCILGTISQSPCQEFRASISTNFLVKHTIT